MKKLLQSEYEGDPRFAPKGARRAMTRAPEAAAATREFRYVEPARKGLRERGRRTDGPRSGLAYAAGYAGLAYLFQQSALTLFAGVFGPTSAAAFLFVLAWGLCAPLAVLLALFAAIKIDRSENLRGGLPAIIGFTLGFVGTLDMIVVLIRWLEGR